MVYDYIVPLIDGPNHENNTYTKVVDKNELEFNLLANKYNLCPKIISHNTYEGKIYIMTKFEFDFEKDNIYYQKIDEPHYILISELYPLTLYQYLHQTKDRKIFKKIKKLIIKLHEIGISHGDLSQYNIVINPSTKDIRIIDFGGSEYIRNLRDFNVGWGKLNTVQDILNYEKDENNIYANSSDIIKEKFIIHQTNNIFNE